PNLVGCWRLDNEGSATTALDRSANQNYATLHNGPTWSLTDAAPISMDNIEQLVDISWTCAGNKIVITPNTPLKYLENSTFLATIIDAKDLNGNQIVNPISWQFYVNQNPVHWENANVAYEVGEGSVLSFTERLINDGGKLENYTLSDIPSWLSPTPVNGSIPALFTKSVEFTVDSFVNPGMYEAAITANTDNGFEKLNLEVNVLCPSPDWYVDPSIYQHSMSVTTNLVIEGDTSKDVNDKIG